MLNVAVILRSDEVRVAGSMLSYTNTAKNGFCNGGRNGALVQNDGCHLTVQRLFPDNTARAKLAIVRLTAEY